MSDTQEMLVENQEPGQGGKKRKIKVGLVILLILLGLGIILTTLYFGWIKPIIERPLGATLSVPIVSLQTNTVVPTPELATDVPTEVIPTVPTSTPTKKPVCGEDVTWNFLLIGIDTEGTNYLYGLADVIRVIHVDFAEMNVEMVALPRDLIVTAPDGLFKEENPIKINQGYLFGAPGWTGSSETGSGADSLAQVIYYNFGVPANHYAVVNFTAVEDFIDAIGGVTVDLPYEVWDPDPSLGYFPMGVQTLDGDRALDLMRIRENYSDDFRVGNQSIILKALIKKFMDPAMLLKMPGLINDFKDAFVTDLSIEQVVNLGTCFLKNFDTDNMHSHQAPEGMLIQGMEYIPSLSGASSVYFWDQSLVDWIHQSLFKTE